MYKRLKKTKKRFKKQLKLLNYEILDLLEEPESDPNGEVLTNLISCEVALSSQLEAIEDKLEFLKFMKAEKLLGRIN